MKPIYTIILLALLFPPILNGQSHQLVSAGGGHTGNTSLSLEFSIGEAVISTVNAGG